MTQPTLISCCACRRALIDSSLVTSVGAIWSFCVILLLGLAGGAAHAAITQTGDVQPNPIVPPGPVDVGDSGIGSLRIDNGSTLESSFVTVGEFGIGFATVTDPGSMWEFRGGRIGARGVGRLEILNGAVVDVLNGANYLWLGEYTGGNGTAVVDGLGSVLRVDAPLRVGGDGVGLLQVSGDAIVDVPHDETEVQGQGRVELEGGLLRTGGVTNYGTITGHGTLQLLSSQTVDNYGRIEAATSQYLTFTGLGNNLENFGTISANGGVIEFGERLFNQDTGPTGEGEIALHDGTIRFFPPQSPGSAALENDGALIALGGMNEIYGRVSQEYGGETIVTNDSTLVFHDSFESAAGGLVVHAGSIASFLSDCTLWGRLSVSVGAEDAPTPVQTIGPTELSGPLQVSVAEAYTPQVGDVFQLVSGTDISTDFDSVELPTLPFGMVWELNQNSSSVQLQILATPGGDFNGDGTVDAADYSVWRDALGTDSNLHADGNGNGVIDADDYMIWRANFGAIASSSAMATGAAGALALAAVPEPAAGTLLLVGMVMLIGHRRLPKRQTLPHLL